MTPPILSVFFLELITGFVVIKISAKTSGAMKV